MERIPMIFKGSTREVTNASLGSVSFNRRQVFDYTISRPSIFRTITSNCRQDIRAYVRRGTDHQLKKPVSPTDWSSIWAQAFFGEARRAGSRLTIKPAIRPRLYPPIIRIICIKEGICNVRIAETTHTAKMNQTVATITRAERKLLATIPNKTLVKAIIVRPIMAVWQLWNDAGKTLKFTKLYFSALIGACNFFILFLFNDIVMVYGAHPSSKAIDFASLINPPESFSSNRSNKKDRSLQPKKIDDIILNYINYNTIL